MQKKVMVLFAVAGLLVFASAGPRPAPGTRAGRLDARLRTRDSLRMLHARRSGAALPSGIDVNKAIRQARRDPKPASLYDFDVIELGDEFMPAPWAPSGDQPRAAVAFDGTNYLVVWEDYSGNNINIRGARVRADGTLLNPQSSVISAYTGDQGYPAVAFDGTNYLVVWEDNRNGNRDIYGARVNPGTGSVVAEDVDGRVIYVESGSDQTNPSVAYGGGYYLVAWDDDSRDALDIYGARVSPSMVVDPNHILITYTEEETWQWNSSVAFDGTNYLVVWGDWRHTDWIGDIYGARVVPSTGELVEGDEDGHLISTNVNDTEQDYPSVAFDGTNYLVVWNDWRNKQSTDVDIYGARVSPGDCSPLGAGDSAGIAVSTATASQGEPSVAFDGTDWLVVWVDDVFGARDIQGCQVSPDADVGSAFDISTRACDYPSVACGSAEGSVLIAYQSETGVVGELDYDDHHRIWARPGVVPMGSGNVGTVSIARPAASYLLPSCVIPPKASVYNYGDYTRSFAVKFTITPGTWSSTKIVLSLASHGTGAVEFAPHILRTGVFTAKCSTMLADDGTKTNDSMTAIFQGCDFINFFDLEDGDLVATGAWTRDTAKRTAWTWPPMDSIVWGDGIYGNYGDNENSTLTSPEYEASQANPSIAFQHSYNTTSGSDGGNFSYSTGSYSRWDTLFPSAGKGYDGPVSALSSRGWSGNSGGWVQSVFTIPVSATRTFKVRWRFASDATSEDLPGWLIDEVAGIGCDVGGKMGAAGYIDTMKVWPNPAHGKAQVSYTLRKAGNVTVKLYDASGRLARQLPTSGFRKGRNTATLDATRLARGVYFVKVEGQSNTKTSKIIIE